MSFIILIYHNILKKTAFSRFILYNNHSISINLLLILLSTLQIQNRLKRLNDFPIIVLISCQSYGLNSSLMKNKSVVFWVVLLPASLVNISCYRTFISSFILLLSLPRFLPSYPPSFFLFKNMY